MSIHKSQLFWCVSLYRVTWPLPKWPWKNAEFSGLWEITLLWYWMSLGRNWFFKPWSWDKPRIIRTNRITHGLLISSYQAVGWSPNKNAGKIIELWWMFQQWLPVNWPKIMVKIAELVALVVDSGVLVWWEWYSLMQTLQETNVAGCEITHKWRFIAGKIIPGEFSIATFDYWREAYSFTIFLFLDHICEIVYESAEKIKRWSFLLGIKRWNMTQVLKM